MSKTVAFQTIQFGISTVFKYMPPYIQHYKVRINGKVEQSREWSGALPYTSV